MPLEDHGELLDGTRSMVGSSIAHLRRSITQGAVPKIVKRDAKSWWGGKAARWCHLTQSSKSSSILNWTSSKRSLEGSHPEQLCCRLPNGCGLGCTPDYTFKQRYHLTKHALYIEADDVSQKSINLNILKPWPLQFPTLMILKKKSYPCSSPSGRAFSTTFLRNEQEDECLFEICGVLYDFKDPLHVGAY